MVIHSLSHIRLDCPNAHSVGSHSGGSERVTGIYFEI